MKGKILIVEDEKELLSSLKDLLTKAGAQVICAENGLAGAEMIHREMPDAVISDIQMPALSGLELLKKIREEGNAVPFILITGFPDNEKILTALRLGAQDFIEKPFNKEKILGAAEKALEFGLALKKVEEELGCGSCISNISSKCDSRFDKMRKTAIQLKIESQIYEKKKSS